MGVSKFVYGGVVKFDLTSDTVTADTLLSGHTAHGKDGELINGSCTFDVDSSEATAAVAEVLATKTFGARGSVMTGTMPNNGAVSGAIATKSGSFTIPQGYHDGGGSVSISATETAKVIPGNIKSGISILGVTGTYGGEAVSVQAKSVNATTTTLTVLPDAGYDYLSQVTVTIPYTETDNSAGGKTITIG